MSAAAQQTWGEYAQERLQAAGFRRGGARLAVIELLERQSCALSALEIEEQLRLRGEKASRASIYRTLEQLEELGLLHRLEVGSGIASFEPADPTGHHHHHIVCERCGKVVPFEDPKLESAISAVEQGTEFAISGHEVTLRGHCPNC